MLKIINRLEITHILIIKFIYEMDKKINLNLKMFRIG